MTSGQHQAKSMALNYKRSSRKTRSTMHALSKPSEGKDMGSNEKLIESTAKHISQRPKKTPEQIEADINKSLSKISEVSRQLEARHSEVKQAIEQLEKTAEQLEFRRQCQDDAYIMLMQGNEEMRKAFNDVNEFKNNNLKESLKLSQSQSVDPVLKAFLIFAFAMLTLTFAAMLVEPKESKVNEKPALKLEDPSEPR